MAALAPTFFIPAAVVVPADAGDSENDALFKSIVSR
jgi:hypothetical protein